MASITWDSTTPAQTSRATDTDDVIRADLATIATGLGAFMYWPGSGASAGSAGSTGQFLTNTARVSDTTLEAGTDSIASDGFLSLHTKPGVNMSRLRHIGSTGSFLIAHPMSLEHTDAPNATAPFVCRWEQRSGTAVGLGGENLGQDFVDLGVTYGGKPVVIGMPSTNSVIVGIYTAAGESNFSSLYSYVGPDGDQVGYDLHWVSIGTVDF
jgi:hypothetical protein